MTLKMAVLAPTPRAMVSAAVRAKTGLLRRDRPASASSFMSMYPPGQYRSRYASYSLADSTQAVCPGNFGGRGSGGKSGERVCYHGVSASNKGRTRDLPWQNIFPAGN